MDATSPSYSDFTPSIEQQTADEALRLIAAVARRKVEVAVLVGRDETVLYSIEGLSPPVTRAIARAIATGIGQVQVHVHPCFDAPDDPLPATMLSEQPPAHWRNLSRDQGNVRAIVFAADGRSIDTAGETIAAIRKLDMQALLDDVKTWLDACHFPFPQNSGDRVALYLQNALEGLTNTDLVLNLPMFAQFILRLAKEFEERSVNNALDAALPALRIPRDAGKFRPLPARGRIIGPPQWTNHFAKIEKDTRDKLYLRNERGAPLDRKSIRKRAESLAEEGLLDTSAQIAVMALTNDTTIQAGHWTATQETFVQHSWSQCQRVFAQGRAEIKRLGTETIAYFEDEHPGTLSEEDKRILDAFAGTPGMEVGDEERDFFFDNQDLLRARRSLFKRWERVIFQQGGIHSDLLAGILLAFQHLLTRSESLPPMPRLFITLDGAEKKSFWADKNTALCRYLKYRYRGLPKALAPYARLDFGLCWTRDWEAEIGDDNTSRSVDATELRFSVALINEDVSDASLIDTTTVQFVWKLPANMVAGGLAGDLRTLAPTTNRLDAALLAGEFSRNPRADRGQDQRVHLADRNSLLDAYKQDGGELFNPNKNSLNMGDAFLVNLDKMKAQYMFGNPPTAVVTEIRNAFLAFRRAYTNAINAMADQDGDGLADPALIEQAERYGHLLLALKKFALFPRAYQELWRPILRIGVATNHGLPLAILTPFAPLRLAELSIKALQMGDLLKTVFEDERDALERLQVLFDVESAQLAGTYYGDVALSSEITKSRLLTETEHLADYSLLEPPVADDPNSGFLHDSPARESVDQFFYVAEHYLEIQPHERANFSCVLYNAESRELPALLTDKLGRKIESEDDLRCDLILTHDNPAQLRRIYAQQNAAIGGELDAVLASEATRSFLSRLRVGFNDVNDVGGTEHRSPADLVFMQEVLSRDAELSWRTFEPYEYPDLRTHKPTAWGRQCPFNPQDQTSAVYMTAPRLPAACQAYVDGLRMVLATDQDNTGDRHYLPVRQINYGDIRVKNILDKAHLIGNWVVTHDSIADRRLFENHQIRIIRYLTRPGADRKLIVSTRKPSAAIGTTLRERISFIEPALTPAELSAILDESLIAAARLSGQVVLRAAQNEQRALELLGLALTRTCIARAFDRHPSDVIWFFLDDIAGWLGHREGKVADILAVVPYREGDQRVIELFVAESKFVSEPEWSTSLTKAKKQLLNTLEGLRYRLLGDATGPEQAIWLRRLSDLMFEHIDPYQSYFEHPARQWVDAVRDGTLPLRLRGGIFGFVYDQDQDIEDLADLNEELPDDQTLCVFNRPQTGQLLKALGGLESITPMCPCRWTFTAPSASSSDVRSVPDVEQKAKLDDSHPTSLVMPNEESRPAEPSIQRVTSTGSRWPTVLDGFIQTQTEAHEDVTSQAWLVTMTGELKQALLKYDLKPKVLETRLTPNAGLVKFAGSDYLTVDKVKRRQLELKTSHAIDVIRISAGLGEVIVLVRRPNRVVLPLAQLWSRRTLPVTAPDQNLSLLLGEREDNGNLLYLNLLEPFGDQPEHAPHCLIAGESGSGKGVLVQNLLLDLCATNAPESLNIIMIDPKEGVDYAWLEDMPHVREGLITNRDQAVTALGHLVEEMNHRYALFRSAKAKKLSHYNHKVAAGDRLPFICLFHDEMTDWMLIPEYRDQVTTSVSQLAAKARAAGIHLFFIAQRPDKDALPMQLRANLGNRLALKVADERNSRIVLDDAGAEDLLGRGHLAAKLTGEGQPILAQVPYLGEEESESLAAVIQEYWRSRR